MKNQKTLTIQFTNLTPIQKETLQQMFAYMQKCSLVGATRTISFLWDAGWGMHSNILFGKTAFNDDTPEKCNVGLAVLGDSEGSKYFDLTEGYIGLCEVIKK